MPGGWLTRPIAALHRAASRSAARSGERRDRLRDDAQSIGFAVDLCRVLQDELTTEEERRLDLLDVGARTAAGSNLIAQAFHPLSWSRLKIEVTAIDMDPFWSDWAALNFPDVRYRVENVLDTTGMFDAVTCSHTLEHIEDPRPVFRRLCALARELVVIAAPWKEPTETMYENHYFRFDEAFFEEFPPSELRVFSSPHWGGSDCFVATYRVGTGD